MLQHEEHAPGMAEQAAGLAVALVRVKWGLEGEGFQQEGLSLT